MSLEREIQRWIRSEEFNVFYEKAEYAMALVLESQEGSFDHIQPYLIELGRRYNHFLFTVTEDVIQKAHENGNFTTEEIAQATAQFISKLEDAIEAEYPLVFLFFLKYRENLKKTFPT